MFEGVYLSEAEIYNINCQLQDRVTQLGNLLPSYIDIKPDSLTLADCGFPITFLWIEKLSPYLNIEIIRPASVTKYLHNLTEIDAVHEEIASYSAILEKFLKEEFAPS